MKRYIRANNPAEWDGIFDPKFIMRYSELSEEQAKELSDYLYEEGYDAGFSSCKECARWIEDIEGGFDEIYSKMKK